MNPWYDQREAIIQAIEAGAAEVDELHTPTVGPITYSRADYPYTEILPEASQRDGGNNWDHTVRLNCYFERHRPQETNHEGQQYLSQLSVAMDATKEALAKLAAETVVNYYVPRQIEDYAGELDNTSVLLISVQIAVGTAVDLAKET